MNCQLREEATVPRLKTDVEVGGVGGERFIAHGLPGWEDTGADWEDTEAG